MGCNFQFEIIRRGGTGGPGCGASEEPIFPPVSPSYRYGAEEGETTRKDRFPVHPH